MRLRNIQLWMENHLQAFVSGLGELFRTPVASILTLLVIGIAMAFPASLLALLQNAQQLEKKWHNASITLYLQPRMTDNEVNNLLTQIRQRNDVAEVTYISPAQALTELNQNFNPEDLPENPLPGTLLVTPKIATQETQSLENLVAALQQLPGIDSKQMDTVWIKRLYEILNLCTRLTWGLLLLFGIGVSLIVANTLRLTIQNHHQEMRVLRLIGATCSFIRRPMLYRGALYGLLGGLIAWLLVMLLFWWLKAPAARLAASYFETWKLQGLNYGSAILMLIGCTALSLIGSWFSVEYYLRAPEEDLI